MDKISLARYLDFANHHQNSADEDIKDLCQKAIKLKLHSVFVNPVYVPLARTELGEGGIVGTVVSFPLGQDSTEVKLIAAQKAIKAGANELDISMNVGWFKSGQHLRVSEEMKKIVALVRQTKINTVVKFIIETGFLSDEEIKKASLLVVGSGAHFVKTCSGLGPRGATVKDVELIKAAIGHQAKIKVAGGIDTYQKAVDFINAGAHRIGTSKAIEILSGVPVGEVNG